MWFTKKNKDENVKSKSVGGVATAARMGVLGMSVAGTLATGLLIKPWEGREYVAYQDVGGVWAYCDGITDKKYLRLPPYRYTDDECDIHLAREVNAHEDRLQACLNPEIELPELTKASFVSFTFNVGSGAACRSTLVRKANAGDLEGACNELSNWVFVGKQKFRGLENRRFKGDATRVSERTVCRIGIDPAYKTPLFEKVYVGYKNWKSNVSEGL